MSELIPCPFCGSDKPSCEDIETRHGTLWYVFCIKCGASGGHRHTVEEAIKAWNTRASYEEAVSNIRENMKAFNKAVNEEFRKALNEEKHADEPDSREKLEADAWNISRPYQPTKQDADAHLKDILELLDRQAVITERHWMEIVGASANCNIELMNQNAKLQAQVERIAAERDNLAKDLADSMEQLSAERERFREASSTVLDAVHQVERTVSNYWNK